MQEGGLFKYWAAKDEVELNEMEELNSRNVKILTISDVKSIFICLGIGFALANLCFLLEMAKLLNSELYSRTNKI